MDITSRIIAHNRKKINEAYRKENLREDDSKDIQRQTVNKRRSEDPDYPMKTLQKDRKDELTPGTADVNEDHMDDCGCDKCNNMNESKKSPTSFELHNILSNRGFTHVGNQNNDTGHESHYKHSSGHEARIFHHFGKDGKLTHVTFGILKKGDGVRYGKSPKELRDHLKGIK